MKYTVKEVLDDLEKPENESEIQHLAHLKHLQHLGGMKRVGGMTGALSGLALRFASKHMDALMELAECKSTADIIEFKKTKHYKKIIKSSITIGDDLEISDLSQLERLKELETSIPFPK